MVIWATPRSGKIWMKVPQLNYELTKAGSEYVGKAMGIYMGIVCGIGMILAVCVEEIISKVRQG